MCASQSCWNGEQKDLVPLLVPLLPWWSAHETGVFTKTGVRNGSLRMDQSWFQWVKKALAPAEVWKPDRSFWNFDYFAAAELFNTATDALGLSGFSMCQTRHSGASIRSGSGFSNTHSARNPKTRSVAPLSPSSAPRQIGNTRATCRGVADKSDSCSSGSETHEWKVFA